MRNEIWNKIEWEIINVNKIISNKRRGTESKEKVNWRVDMNFCINNMQSEKEREEKKSNFRPNHAEPPYTRHLERKKTSRQIKMIQQNFGSNRRSKLHAPLEYDGADDACELFHFLCAKTKNAVRTKQ
jgi:hypothetical protein